MARPAWLEWKSRMRRELHVRFCEGGGVRFPPATRLSVLRTIRGSAACQGNDRGAFRWPPGATTYWSARLARRGDNSLGNELNQLKQLQKVEDGLEQEAHRPLPPRGLSGPSSSNKPSSRISAIHSTHSSRISASMELEGTNDPVERGVPEKQLGDESLTLESSSSTEEGDVEQCVEADEPRIARRARLAA